MKIDNVLKYGISPEGIGMLKISVWADGFVLIENHCGIIDIKEQCIKVNTKKHILAVNGQNLSISELDGCNLKIKGKIFGIEYLT